MGEVKVITSDFVNLQVSTSKNDVSFGEKRFPKDITVADLKVGGFQFLPIQAKLNIGTKLCVCFFQAKLELMTGGSCQTMKVEAYNKDNKLVTLLSDNDQLVGFYPLEDGMRLHVVDDFLIRNEFDSENVPKFELSEDDYAKRDDTVKNFLMKNKIGSNYAPF